MVGVPLEIEDALLEPMTLNQFQKIQRLRRLSSMVLLTDASHLPGVEAQSQLRVTAFFMENIISARSSSSRRIRLYVNLSSLSDVLFSKSTILMTLSKNSPISLMVGIMS